MCKVRRGRNGIRRGKDSPAWPLQPHNPKPREGHVAGTSTIPVERRAIGPTCVVPVEMRR